MERILQELNVLVDTVPEPVYIGNEKGIYHTNKAGLELLGLERIGELQEPINFLNDKHYLRDPSTEEILPEKENPFFIALKGKKVCKEVLVKQKKTGKDLFLRISASPIKQDNEIVAVVSVCIDITDYRKAEKLLKQSAELSRKRNQELVRTNNELDNFFYTVSHDLKAPVNNVEGLVSLFRHSDISQQERENMVNMLDGAINQLKQIIHDLTDLNKIQKDLKEEKYEYVSFGEISEEVESVIYQMLSRNCVHIHKHFEVEGIDMSRKNLRSILYNLLSNAAKYRAPDRSCVIHIRSFLENNHIVLSVKDNGLGIDTSKKQLFQMFRRHHSHVEGTGLGLFIVKRIVDHYAGNIIVDSEEGKGSEFKLSFPFIKNF